MALQWFFIQGILLLNAALSLPCIPQDNRTALLIGQDLYSISNYTSTMNNIPFGTMSYTSLSNLYGNLTGLLRPINYGSGIEWAAGLVSLYPGRALQIGLWVVDQCSEIAAGEKDFLITELAKSLNSLNVPVYLRIGYEFDSSENRYVPAEYTAAFQRIVNITRLIGTDKIAFVWHASGFEPRNSIDISAWFPGLDYVDWCGVSIFQQPYECNNSSECSMPAVENLIQYCQYLALPVMIAESTPYGGIVSNGSNSAGFVGNSWERWFRHVVSLIDRYDIKMWCYINCDWDAQPMWRVNHAPGQPWGDTRIEAAPTGLIEMWQVNVLNQPRYSWSVSAADKNIRGGTDFSDESIFYRCIVQIDGSLNNVALMQPFLNNIDIFFFVGTTVLIVILFTVTATVKLLSSSSFSYYQATESSCSFFRNCGSLNCCWRRINSNDANHPYFPIN
jgi:hypothetical protein